MTALKNIVSALLLTTLSFSASAVDNEEEIGFETIISQLNKSSNKVRQKDLQEPSTLIDDVRIHSGVGFVQSFVRVNSPTKNTLQGFHQGIQASLGIDLFSRNWIAEGTIRSFGEESIEDSQVKLREFDLKVIYHNDSRSLFGYRAGFGLAARNLTLIENGKEEKFSTPATIALFGIDTHVSRTITIGGELSYRTALVSESADRSSVDIALKFDAHF